MKSMKAWIVVGVLAAACEGGTTEVDCDDDVEVPLLRLELDETATVAGRTDAGWIVEVQTHSGPVADALGGAGASIEMIDRRVVVVEGCDAEPRTIADGLGKVHAPPLAGLPWIAESQVALDQSPPLWRIDPAGEEAPVQITGRYSWIAWTEDGALVVDADDEDGGALVRVRETDDGVTTTLERDDVKRVAIGKDVVQERVAFVTTDDDLVVRDLASGEEQLVRPGVDVVWSSDARSRFLMLTTAGEEQAMVVDADEGTAIDLVAGTEDEVVLRWMTTGSGQAQVFGDGGVVESQVVLFPELRELRFQGEWWCSDCTREESDSVLLSSPDGLYVLHDGADVPVQLRAVPASGFFEGDHIYAFEVVLPSAGTDPHRTTHRLVRLDLDGSNAVDLLLGDTASDVVRLSRDRWAYSRKLGGDLVGELVVMDTARAEREEVADDVLFQVFSRIGAEPEDTNELPYFAVSEDPERHGLWLVHVDRLFD